MEINPPRKRAERLDNFLFNNGFADTFNKAQALIMAGLVEVDGRIELKAGFPVTIGARITVNQKLKYVSRAGIKLEGALKIFNISPSEKICLDIGASTGGFTDCLLQHGAKKVYSVDVGHGLLHPKIAKDLRVVNIENTNFRNFSAQTLKDPVQFCTIDVSFISLKLILPNVAKVVAGQCDILAMIKPQFEANAKDLRRGIVKNEVVRVQAINMIRDFGQLTGFSLLGGVDSSIKGRRGNVEHFLWLRTT